MQRNTLFHSSITQGTVSGAVVGGFGGLLYNFFNFIKRDFVHNDAEEVSSLIKFITAFTVIGAIISSIENWRSNPENQIRIPSNYQNHSNEITSFNLPFVPGGPR